MNHSRESRIESVFPSQKLVLVSGKGGIGKSLVCASQGVLHSLYQGKKTLIVENSFSSQLFPLFGLFQRDTHPVHADTEVSKNLYVANLNTKLCFKEYLVDHLGFETLYKRIFSHDLVNTFLETIPGLAEVMMLGRLLYSSKLQDAAYSKVIFDAPASGHFLKLITTPDSILGSGIAGPLLKEIKKIREFFVDEQSTAIVWVTDADELAVRETLDILPALIAQSPTQVSKVILNRTLPIGEEVKRGIEKLPPDLSLYLTFASAKQGNAKGELEAGLAKLRTARHPLEIVEIPLIGKIEEPLTLQQSMELWGLTL